MSDFRIKSREAKCTLRVTRDNGPDLLEDEKVLAFDVSPTNYKFIKACSATATALKDATADLSAANIDKAYEAEKSAFELMAPGKWDEYFEFLGEDVFDMALLIAEMTKVIRAKGIEAKAAALAAAIPSDAQEV